MSLNRRGEKELHYFERFVVEEWEAAEGDRYRALFDEGGGEWTPAYLRSLWVPPLIEEAAPAATLLVVLRDSIERYKSGIRWYFRNDGRPTASWYRHGGVEAIWGGMYATQLDTWRRECSNRILVYQYESVVKDPVSAVQEIWSELGLNPMRVVDVHSPSWTSTSGDEPEVPPGLADVYRPEVIRLADDWGIDPNLWSLGI